MSLCILRSFTWPEKILTSDCSHFHFQEVYTFAYQYVNHWMLLGEFPYTVASIRRVNTWPWPDPRMCFGSDTSFKAAAGEIPWFATKNSFSYGSMFTNLKNSYQVYLNFSNKNVFILHNSKEILCKRRQPPILRNRLHAILPCNFSGWCCLITMVTGVNL